MSTLEIILAVVGVGLALAQIIQARKITRLEHQREKDQGLYDKANLKLAFFEDGLGRTFYYYLPFDKFECVLAPLNMIIMNTGKKMATNIELVVNGSKILLQGNYKKTATDTISFREVKFKKLDESDFKTTLGWHVSKLSQMSAFQLMLELPLYDETTEREETIQINTADNVLVDLTYLATFEYKMNFWLHADDQRASTNELSIQVFNSSKIDLKKYLIDKAKEQNIEILQELKELSFLKRTKYKRNIRVLKQIQILTCDKLDHDKNDNLVSKVNEVDIITAYIGRGTVWIPQWNVFHLAKLNNESTFFFKKLFSFIIKKCSNILVGSRVYLKSLLSKSKENTIESKSSKLPDKS